MIRVARRLVRLLLLCLAASAWAATDADLQPIPENSLLHGRLSAVGAVIVGKGEHVYSIGTGFLVTPCHVLTAAHVLASENTQVAPGLEVRFVPSDGDNPLSFNARPLYGNVVAMSENFIFRGQGSPFDADNIARDWALVELQQPLPDVEPLKLLYPGATLPSDSAMDVVGYAATPHPSYLYAEENCRLWRGHHDGQRINQLLVADCAVRQGMSGGPLLFESGGQLVAAGIIVERVEVGERIFTVAVPSRSFADKITPLMRSSNVCAAGQPFAMPPEAAGSN